MSLNRPNVVKGDIKFFHGFDSPKAVVCSRYTCCNPACCRMNGKGKIIPIEFSASSATQIAMLPDAARIDFDFVLMPSGRGGYTGELRSFLLNSCAKQMQDVATVAEQVRIHWPLLLSPVSSLSPPLMSSACAVPAPPRFAAGEVDLLLQAAAEWAAEWAAATDFDQYYHRSHCDRSERSTSSGAGSIPNAGTNQSVLATFSSVA